MDLEERLNRVDYEAMATTYRPSQFAVEFVNFIKLVNGGAGEENKSPLIHYDMIDQVIEEDQNLFVSFRGSAKCLSVDTNVMTPEGLVRLEDIEVGDTVLDRNGVPTEVVIASEVFTNKPCYRIELANGYSFIATDDHVHFVERRTQNAEKRNVWVEEELTTSELLSKGVYYSRSKTYRNPKGKEAKWRIPRLSLAGEAIVNIVQIDTVPTKCIGVASDTSSYIIEGGYITHNTSALHEYMILYLATFGEIPNFGRVDVGMYISDTIDNGVKSMRTNLEHRWNNSEFLQKYVPEKRFTDVRWEFCNIDGKHLCFRGFGANTGVRGFKEYGKRPTWLGLDDLMSDKNSESATITRDIKHIIYKAARQAMHPRKRKTIWTGTPFNKSDPLYEAAGSTAWNTRVYPIAEKFPCTREEFRGGWEDRFNYDFVKREYDSLLASGEIQAFNQELMLRITSDEDRLVQQDDIIWYSRKSVYENRSLYNFYVTTDFATSKEKKADFSVIMVWAYTNSGVWLLVDGICKRQLMDENINDLFRLCSIYKPLSVGIEINGQQGGFLSWVKSQMIERNIFFNLAKQGSKEGIRRTAGKIESFKLFVPVIKAKKVWFPEELKDSPLLVETLEELQYATRDGFKSKHDDAADCMSMLQEIDAYKPSAEAELAYVPNEEGTYGYFTGDNDEDIYKNNSIF